MPEPLPDGREDIDSTPKRDPSVPELTVGRSFSFGKQLPLDVLPPDTIARLMAGGEISRDELAIVQSAVLEDAGPLGKLLQTALSSQAGASSSMQVASVSPVTAPPTEDARVVPLPGGVQSFEWRWSGERAQEPVELEPATYYEALTGRRDPARNFFISMRRLINAIVWVIALGVPLMLVGLAIATGQSLETIVFMGIGAFAVGMMFRKSFPRTPFG